MTEKTQLTEARNTPDISVSLCTYKRQNLLRTCLGSLMDQSTDASYEVIVVDNDAQASARAILEACMPAFREHRVDLTYVVEPEQDLCLARNRGVSMARGKFVAFIDDDEYPDPQWLDRLLDAIETDRADGACGPVLPVYPEGFPQWMKSEHLFGRPRRETGRLLRGTDCATNNAPVKRTWLLKRPGPFNPAFGSIGGEDTALFSWLLGQACTVCGCDEAIVFEHQEIRRASWRWHLRRAYRGSWGFSRVSVESQGYARGALYSVARVFPSLTRGLCQSVWLWHNPKLSALLLARSIATNAGKLGYFVGAGVHEYSCR